METAASPMRLFECSLHKTAGKKLHRQDAQRSIAKKKE